MHPGQVLQHGCLKLFEPLDIRWVGGQYRFANVTVATLPGRMSSKESVWPCRGIDLTHQKVPRTEGLIGSGQLLAELIEIDIGYRLNERPSGLWRTGCY